MIGREFLQKSGQILKNKMDHMIQNPSALGADALIIASAVLVLSRIIIANVSAVKARGTSEGPYRWRETIRTTMREIGGWTFGFGVLRLAQNKLKGKLGEKLGVHTPAGFSMWKSFANIGKTSLAQLEKQGADLTKSVAPTWNNNSAASWVQNFLKTDFANKIVKQFYAGSQEKFVMAMHNLLPIAIASVPAVGLSGYALERITREHSDQVVDVVSKVFGGKKSQKSASPEVKTTAISNSASPNPTLASKLPTSGLVSSAPSVAAAALPSAMGMPTASSFAAAPQFRGQQNQSLFRAYPQRPVAQFGPLTSLR